MCVYNAFSDFLSFMRMWVLNYASMLVKIVPCHLVLVVCAF
jgi:hypothetical protein